MLSLALTAALHLVAIRFARSRGPVERLRTVAEGGLVIVCYLFGVWLLDGAPGSFWPVWPALAIALVLAAAAVVVLAPWSDRDELSERIAVLTRTRRDTVEAQTTELRRIERDLHDGAQARLVALSMQLGRAEARLADRPEDAQLVREARAEASAAIAELRDLARGIAPPVLVDRGLVAAIEALARRQAGPVAVEAGETGRLPAAVESCAYFVCAEALTNIAKHAPGAQATVRIAKDDGTLRLTIADDGPGGADSAGSGLAGLRHRVQALDGRLAVASASGGGTTITAEIPCAS
ncbi:MAG: histidine kinase [Baekduia sp.]